MSRAEIAQIMNPRIKWTYKDFVNVNVLKETSYSKIDYIPREEKRVSSSRQSRLSRFSYFVN